MMPSAANSRRIGPAVLMLACLAVGLASAWTLLGKRSTDPRQTATSALAASDVTASTGKATKSLGPSGLPLPRFVSLKAERVNVRRGPSSDHDVAWVFQRKGLPVEIIAEFENWRRIRDSDGEEGWVYQSMLSGKRTAVVAPWRKDDALPLYTGPEAGSSLVAKLRPGVVSTIEKCTGSWCDISAGGYEGWMEQPMLWGVYPGEEVD
jgi:SH3-like domain-containing protein